MGSAAVCVDCEYPCAFATGLDATAGGRWFQHKDCARISRDRFHECAAVVASRLFVTRQQHYQRMFTTQLEFTQCSNYLQRQYAAAFHIKHAWTVRFAVLDAPRPLRE